MKPKPTVGRIIHYMLEASPGVLNIRPAIIVRVGPAKVGEPDTGQLGLRVFTEQNEGVEPIFRESREAPADVFRAGTWRWPPRE